MIRRTHPSLATSAVLALLLSGCAAPAAQNQHVEEPTAAGSISPTLENVSTSAQEPREILLAEGVARAERCAWIFGPQVSGCPIIVPDGPLIPAGTTKVRLEADATGARMTSGFSAWFQTPARTDSQPTDGTSSPVHVWEFDVRPEEWDGATWTRSQAIFGFIPAGPQGVIEGDIRYRVSATVIPPPEPDAAATGPEAQPVVLFAQDVSFREQFVATEATYVISSLPPLERTVPETTTIILLGIAWSIVDGCNVGDTCYMRSDVVWANQTLRPWKSPVAAQGPDHFIAELRVGEDFEVDTAWATRSLVEFQPYLIADCAASPVVGPGCGGSNTERGAELTIRVEAFSETPDIDAFERRLLENA